jgi:hypothetical protein
MRKLVLPSEDGRDEVEGFFLFTGNTVPRDHTFQGKIFQRTYVVSQGVQFHRNIVSRNIGL